MHIFMYVGRCVYVCMYTHTYITYICICKYAHVYVYILYEEINLGMYVVDISVYMHACMHIGTCILVHRHASAYIICMFLHMYSYIFIYVHVCIYVL